MMRVAIIGGGISGLSAAYYLDKARRAGAQLQYTLFEAAHRVGGVIQTHRVSQPDQQDFVIEAGADSFLTAKPWAAELAKDLGIGDQLMGSNDRSRKTYILINRKLVPMPNGLQMMVPTKLLPMTLSPLFSWGAKLRMMREYLWPSGVSSLKAGADESVASFVGRHFGQEVVDKLANPLLAGVYGGDSGRLSARAVLPRFVEMEAEHGSLVRGMLRAAKNDGSAAKPSIFTTFKAGMQQLVDAVVNRLDEESIRTNTAVERIEEVSGRWKITHAAEQVAMFDRVIVATAAYSAAKMLRSVDTALAQRLEEIPYEPSVTVALEYANADSVCARIPQGFGFLVPRTENIPVMACTFVQNKFEHRVAAGSALLRMFLTDAIDWPDDKIREVVKEQAAKILKVTMSPDKILIFRWPRSMPQYEVGHLERVTAIEKITRGHPGLELIGNAYRGIGVPDCVREGKYAAGRVLKGIFAKG